MWWIESNPTTIPFPPAPLWGVERVETMIAMEDRLGPTPTDPARKAPVALSRSDVEANHPNGYDARLKNPTTVLSTRQILHIFLSQGLCAMLIAGAINFAIGYGTSPLSPPSPRSDQALRRWETAHPGSSSASPDRTPPCTSG